MSIAAIAAPRAVEAQQPGKTYRVGFLGLSPLSDPDTLANYDSFRQALRDHGFVEGRNLDLRYRTSDAVETQFPALVGELLAAGADVLVTLGSAATLAAKRATATVPIVMAAVPNPEMLGLVASLARPGGNVTGMSTMLLDTTGKIQELIRESLPGRTRVAVLGNSDNPGSARGLKSEWAPGFVKISVDIRTAADLAPAYDRVIQERAQVLFAHAIMWTYRDRILRFAATHRLPVVFSYRSWALHGAFLTFGPALRDNLRKVGVYVVKILKGIKPADLPVEQPTRFELVINLKTAKALGLTVPPALLVSADEVIE